jgi:hypothetical protein
VCLSGFLPDYVAAQFLPKRRCLGFRDVFHAFNSCTLFMHATSSAGVDALCGEHECAMLTVQYLRHAGMTQHAMYHCSLQCIALLVVQPP